MSTSFVWFDYRFSKERFYDNTRERLSSGSQTSSIAVYHLNIDLSEVIVQDLIEYPTIILAVIVDHHGNTIARQQRSAVLSRYRWISDAILGKNTLLQQPLYSPAPQEAFLGYLIIEVDTFVVAKNFLERAGLILLGGMILTLSLSTLLIWLNRKHLIHPIQSTLNNISQLNPHHPGDIKIQYPNTHHLDEIGAWIELTNQLISSVNTHVKRRDRAENDLRKNLGSIEHIVSERTEILLNQNHQLQKKLASAQKTIGTLNREYQNSMTQPIVKPPTPHSFISDNSLSQPKTFTTLFQKTLGALVSASASPINAIELDLPEDIPFNALGKYFNEQEGKTLLLGLLQTVNDICQLSNQTSDQIKTKCQVNLKTVNLKTMPSSSSALSEKTPDRLLEEANPIFLSFHFEPMTLPLDSFENLLKRPAASKITSAWHHSWQIIDKYHGEWHINLAAASFQIALDFCSEPLH